jgi:hypothetical protein
MKPQAPALDLPALDLPEADFDAGVHSVYNRTKRDRRIAAWQ